jgi:hypothetical protein
MTRTLQGIRLALAVAGALTVLSTPGYAQIRCDLAETVTQCINRELAKTDTQGVNAAKVEQKQAPKKTETSLDDINGLSSSVKDFLPLLQLGGVLGAVQTDDKSGLVTVALNTPFIGSSGMEKKDNALQLRAVIDTTAKLFEPLKAQLPAANRDTLAKQLTTAKTDAENVTLQGSYNFSSRRFGRNFHQHEDTLDALFAEALRSAASARTAFNASLIALSNAHPGVSFTVPIKTLKSADVLQIESEIATIVAAEAKLDAALATAIRQSGLDVYGQLVTNQPQLQFSFSRSFRDDLYGPDLVTGRVSYEMGLDNTLNSALGSYNGTCAANAAACFKTYSAFAGSPATRAAIKDGSRVSFWAEFVWNEDYHFTRTDPLLDLTIADGTGWTAGLDYGRLLGVDDRGVAAGRFDASLRWESPSDKAKDTRLVATITVTKKFGDMSIPFGLVYANKEKFLTQAGIDKGLTANIGLKFNLFPELK